MNMSKIDMTQGSILGRAAQFALPICIGNILQQLYGTVDTLVIGNYCVSLHKPQCFFCTLPVCRLRC